MAGNEIKSTLGVKVSESTSETMPMQIGKMSEHVESMVHLNEILECALNKLVELNCGGVASCIQPEPAGLISTMEVRNEQMAEQLVVAHDYARQISNLL